MGVKQTIKSTVLHASTNASDVGESTHSHSVTSKGHQQFLQPINMIRQKNIFYTPQMIKKTRYFEMQNCNYRNVEKSGLKI